MITLGATTGFLWGHHQFKKYSFPLGQGPLPFGIQFLMEWGHFGSAWGPSDLQPGRGGSSDKCLSPLDKASWLGELDEHRCCCGCFLWKGLEGVMLKKIPAPLYRGETGMCHFAWSQVHITRDKPRWWNVPWCHMIRRALHLMVFYFPPKPTNPV